MLASSHAVCGAARCAERTSATHYISEVLAEIHCWRAAWQIRDVPVIRVDNQPCWVSSDDWIGIYIAVGVEPRRQPNGIALQIPANARIVVPMPVLMQPRLRIEILARQYFGRSSRKMRVGSYTSGETPVLLDHAVNSYLAALIADGRSHHTVRNARSALRELAAFLSRHGIGTTEQISHEALMLFRLELRSRPTAKGAPMLPGSQREHIGKLRTFCRWLFEMSMVGIDLGKRIPQSRKVRHLPKAVMEIGEVDRMLACPDMTDPAGFRDRVILEVLYSTAIRREEAATLRLHDVDTNGGYLTVRSGKNGKDRVVPLGTSACELLRDFIDEVRPRWPGADATPRLFLTRFGGGMHPAAVWHVVKKYARIAGIRKPVSTHTFRHTCATQMARAGVPIRHLQELLGHESIETTQIYTHLAITDLKAVHSRFHPREKHSIFRRLVRPTEVWAA